MLLPFICLFCCVPPLTLPGGIQLQGEGTALKKRRREKRQNASSKSSCKKNSEEQTTERFPINFPEGLSIWIYGREIVPFRPHIDFPHSRIILFIAFGANEFSGGKSCVALLFLLLFCVTFGHPSLLFFLSSFTLHPPLPSLPSLFCLYQAYSMCAQKICGPVEKLSSKNITIENSFSMISHQKVFK